MRPASPRNPQHRPTERSARPAPDVGALGAHRLRDDPAAHEHCEDLATEAVREHRFERRRHQVSARHTYAAGFSSKPNASTSALTDKNAPMLCAKRFGGPGTSFSWNGNAGVSTRVTN